MAKKTNTLQARIEKREPVVAVMGHVDHGKSTLLDFLRKTNVVDGEAGGITQHVAAYEVEHAGRKITFLDTPGHEAFAATRERGASIADIAILVVSADDGVKEQTLGALEFITNSGIPYVIAINKIDKPGADIQKTKNSLVENAIYIEGMGGDISYTEVSAKEGTNITELLDTVLLASDLDELEGDRNAKATGFVLESSLDPKKGISATMVVKNGSLKIGDYVVCGKSSSPVRIMEDYAGKPMKEASFSVPVRIIGFDTQPEAGSDFSTFTNKKEAFAFIEEAEELTEEVNEEQLALNKQKMAIPLVIKADVQGSVDAIKHQLEKITSNTAYFKVVGEGVGEISEADAKSGGNGKDTMIVGFNVKVSRAAVDLAETFGMDIKTYDIIYELTDYLKEVLETRRPRTSIEKIKGQARVIRVFSWDNKGGVVGGKVKEGSISKKDTIKVIRRDIEIGSAHISELQRGKQAVTEIQDGDEFGMMLQVKFEVTEGDILQSVEVVEE